MRSEECPTCAGALDIVNNAVKTIYCGYCGQPLLVLPAGLDLRGGRAQLAETPTRVKVGDSVSIRARDYDVVGRVQYRFEDGLFDQFFLVGESTAWLEQDEGEFRLFDAIEPVPVAPDWDDLGVGEYVPLGRGRFYTMEFGEGAVVGGQGALPMALVPGDAFFYVDGTFDGHAASLKYSAAGVFLLTGQALDANAIRVSEAG